MNTGTTNADQSAVSKLRQAAPTEVGASSVEPGPALNESPNLPQAVDRAEREPLPGVNENISVEASQPGAALPAAVTQPMAPPEQPDLSDVQATQLLARFLVGSAILGTEELVGRLRAWQALMDSQSGLHSLGEATSGDLVRYLVLGSLAWGSRRAAGAINDGFRLSLGIAETMRSALDWLTDNPLLRPLRRPVDAAIAQVAGEANLWILKGWHEEQISRLLARQGWSRLMNETIDHIAENPQLAQLVRSQINEQSIGLAEVVVDNGRALGVTADDAVETLARRLFRRSPRSAWPSSPAGQTQPGPTAPNEGAGNSGQR